jgi:hypothetical protein
MAKGYKIRLDDGSEIGPMNIEAVEAWFRQGLVRHDNLVQRPGSSGWVALSEVLARDLKGKKATAAAPKPAPAARPAPAPSRPRPRVSAPEPEEEEEEAAPSGLGSGVLKLAGALVVLGALAAGGFWAYQRFFRESEQVRQMRQWASDVAVDPASGYKAPSGWLVLRTGQTLFAAPAEARMLLAHPRSGALGFVATETAPSGVAGVDTYADLVLSRRRQALPGYKEDARREATLGGLPAREATASWERNGVRHRESVRVWKDGWNYNAVVAWAAEGKGEAALAALAGGVPQGGVVAAQQAKAVAAVTAEAPHLSASAVELLMSRSAAQVLEPQEAFRRGQALASAGLASLPPADVRELGRLMQGVYGFLSSRDRQRLAAYLDRVRAGGPTTPEEDRDMCQVMKGGVLKLPADRRSRLQALYEKALRGGLAAGG